MRLTNQAELIDSITTKTKEYISNYSAGQGEVLTRC